MTNALQYGTSVFGGMRGYYNKKGKYLSLFRVDDHFKRLLDAVKILGCDFPYTQKELRQILLDLVKKNNPDSDIYIRPLAFVGNTSITPSLAGVTLDFAIYLKPMGDYLPIDRGLTAAVSSWRRVSENSIPPRGKISGAYINSALARKEASDNGYDEAILLNDQGHVCEGSSENIFLVRDGVLITSGNADDILEGITRRSILQLAKDLKIPVEVRSIARTELYTADEAFFSGTGVQLAWIGQIDKRQVGKGKRGEITSRLQDKFFQLIRGLDPKYKNWCTKVAIK